MHEMHVYSLNLQDNEVHSNGFIAHKLLLDYRYFIDVLCMHEPPHFEARAQ